VREILQYSPWIGPKEGRYDRAFVRWCHRHRHLCLRTVELFWFFRGRHPQSPPTLGYVKGGARTWIQYYRTHRAAFQNELARYYRTARFWEHCGPKMRRDLLRCLRYSNRIPVECQAAQAHPDYLVYFRTRFPERPAYGFVEVKGPRESLRPSQKRFFPELVSKAGQHVWVARVESANRVRFARFNSRGELEPWSSPELSL